ncbi:MAG: CinA family protein [Planctomyces sp.]
MTEARSLYQLADRIAELLLARSLTLILAESCTAGLIAATLGSVPGISRVLAGSAVVYQLKTKSQWLGIDEKLLDDPGPVSEVVAVKMAESVFRMTPHAQIALSITGHLGPDAPEGLDGVAYTAVSRRDGSTRCRKLLLQYDPGHLSEPRNGPAAENHSPRVLRQRNAVQQCLEFLESVLLDDDLA